MTGEATSAGHPQPVLMATADKRRKCSACNYQTVRFYRVGKMPDLDSADPADRGLCSDCFALLLAGEGLFEGTDQYHVVRAGATAGGE